MSWTVHAGSEDSSPQSRPLQHLFFQPPIFANDDGGTFCVWLSHLRRRSSHRGIVVWHDGGASINITIPTVSLCTRSRLCRLLLFLERFQRKCAIKTDFTNLLRCYTIKGTRCMALLLLLVCYVVSYGWCCDMLLPAASTVPLCNRTHCRETVLRPDHQPIVCVTYGMQEIDSFIGIHSISVPACTMKEWTDIWNADRAWKEHCIHAVFEKKNRSNLNVPKIWILVYGH